MGPGLALASIPEYFDSKSDLGCHSAFIGPELFGLVKKGIVTGARKNVNTGKAVSGGLGGGIESEEDLRFIDGNPMFEVRNMSYVNNIQVIASHDRMVAINSVLAIDLFGQIAVDSLHGRMYGGAGGQIDFAIGAALSKGGRFIIVTHATASKGTISRIVPRLEEGTLASIPFTFADNVVTEYGIASLRGKTFRQRAEELIAIAHPDFRPQLKEEAAKLFK
jgi:4-hydroxybutyrate CoA-transferase